MLTLKAGAGSSPLLGTAGKTFGAGPPPTAPAAANRTAQSAAGGIGAEAELIPGRSVSRELLVGQNRKVLGHDVAEERAEDTDVEAASVARADHGLGIELIRGANARIEGPFGRTPTHICADAAVASDPEIAVGGAVVVLHERAVPFAIDCFGEVNLIAHAKVQGEVLGRAPCVLDVEEVPLLEFFCVVRGADIAVERRHLPEREGGPAIAACVR